MVRYAREHEAVVTLLLAETTITRGRNGCMAYNVSLVHILRRTGGRGTSKEAGRLFNVVELAREHLKGKRSPWACAEANALVKYLSNGGELRRIRCLRTIGENGDVVFACNACRVWLAALGLKTSE